MFGHVDGAAQLPQVKVVGLVQVPDCVGTLGLYDGVAGDGVSPTLVHVSYCFRNVPSAVQVNRAEPLYPDFVFVIEL